MFTKPLPTGAMVAGPVVHSEVYSEFKPQTKIVGYDHPEYNLKYSEYSIFSCCEIFVTLK